MSDDSPSRDAGPAPTTEVVRPDRPVHVIVPEALRSVVSILVVLTALAVATLGVLHHGASGPSGPDKAVTAALRTLWPSAGSLAYAVDGLVTPVPILLTVGVLVAASLLTGQRRLAVLALCGPFCVAGATTLLKPVVDRTIHGDNLAFPSGHTGYATAVGLVLGLLLVGAVRPARTVSAVLLLVGPALVTGGAMAVNQVGLDAHYPSDTLGGFCTAVTVVLVLALVTDRLSDRWGASGRGRLRPHQRSATSGAISRS